MRKAAVKAKVILSMEADKETKEKIEAFVRARGCGGAEYEIDPSIGGGVVISIGDRVYDGSVKGRLESVKRSV